MGIVKPILLLFCKIRLVFDVPYASSLFLRDELKDFSIDYKYVNFHLSIIFISGKWKETKE